MLAQRHHIVHAAVDDIVVLLWSACTGTLKFLFSLFFLLPTHVLFILGIAFVWMLVRDSIVYVSLEFGRILDDMLLPVQWVIDGINYAIAFIANIGSYVGNTIKSWF